MKEEIIELIRIYASTKKKLWQNLKTSNSHEKVSQNGLKATKYR